MTTPNPGSFIVGGPLGRIALGILVLISVLRATNAICSIDADNSSVDCMFGIWSEKKCECECIPPYCVDASGRCAAMFICDASNPWANCVRGVDCPWWKNTLKENSCATGPEIPQGVWDVWATQAECCNLYPQNDVCITYEKNKLTKPPTQFPTIGAAKLPDTEIITIGFSGVTIPDGVDVINFQKKLLDIVKIVLVDIAKEYELLNILDVTYRGVDSRTDTLIYDITVTREDGINFGRIIREAIRDRIHFIFTEMIEWLRYQEIGSFNILDLQFCFDWETNSYCTTRQPSKPPTPSPTKQPEDIVVLEFLDIKLPIAVGLEVFKVKMLDVLKGVVYDLAEKYGSLEVIEVEQSDRWSNNRRLTDRSEKGDRHQRSLQRAPFDLVYGVTIIKEPGVDFGPIIEEAVLEMGNTILNIILSWMRNDQGVTNSAAFSFCLDMPEVTDGYQCFSASKPTRRPTVPPTPFPTTPQTQTMAVEFSNVSLPISVNVLKFREKMRLVLKGILDKLAQKYAKLKVLEIKYRDNRRMNAIGEEGHRLLQRVVDLTYDVTISRQDGIDFEVIIQDALRESSDEILVEIVQWIEAEGINEEEEAIFRFCLDTECYATSAAEDPTQTEFYFEEVFPIRFSVRQLPKNIKDQRKLRRELKEVLENVLNYLANRYDFKVLNVIYRYVVRVESRKLYEDNTRHPGIRALHALTRNLADDDRLHHMMFDVTISHRGDIDLEELIEQNYDVIIQDVRENPSGYEVISDAFEFEICVESDSCPFDEADEITYTYNSDSSESTSTSKSVKSVESEETGLPLWAIILIVILCLLLSCIFICCIAYWRTQQQKEIKEESINNNVHIERSRNESKRSTSKYSSRCSDSDSDSSDDSSDESDDEEPKMLPPRGMMALQQYPQQQPGQPLPALPPPQHPALMPPPQQPQFRQLPPTQPHPYMPIIHNNIPEQSPPVLAILDHPHEPSKSSNSTIATTIGDYSSAQYDPSVGGIDGDTYADFESIVRPDPSMYSLFTTRTIGDGKTKKKRKSTRKSMREPSVYSQKSSKTKKSEPSMYLGYGGEDAPGFKTGDSVYMRDGPSVAGTGKLLMIEEESHHGTNSIYSEHQSLYSEAHFATASTSHVPHDPSYYSQSEHHTTASANQFTHDPSYHSQAEQQFTFPNANEAMSMISGHSHMTGHSHGIHSASPPDGSKSKEKRKSKPSKTKKEKSKKEGKTKKEGKSKEKESKNRSYYSAYSAYSDEPTLEPPDRRGSLPKEYVL